MAENKKFTRLINSDGTKQAVALDMVSFDEQTKKLTLYSSVDNTIKEETTIPASEVDTTLSQSGLAADAKATGDAVKDVVKVGGTASGFTGIIVGTGEEEIELVEQKDFDAEIAKLNAKVGTPLVANAASAMVDTTKIYVYTGNENGYVNGNWYFYNGTNWESGGVYNAVAVQTDKTLTQENKAADGKAVGDELGSLKSEFTALESDGAVPSAEQILTDKGVTDSVPYHYRKTGGDGADRLYDQIVGGTVNWNQLTNGGTSEERNGITWTNNNDGTWTANGTASADSVKMVSVGKYPPANHVICGRGCPAGGSTTTFYMDTGRSQKDIGNGLLSMSESTLPVRMIVKSGTTVNNIVFKPKAHDLTAMFGSTIADYIYQLEQTTAGAGVAFFKSLFPKDYYEYNAGELVSVSGLSEHKMVDKNLLDTSVFDGFPTVFIVNTDGSITQLKTDDRNESAMKTLNLKAGTYTFSMGRNVTGIGTHSIYYRENNAWVYAVSQSSAESNTFTLDKERDVYIKISVGTALTYPVTLRPQIELGDIATAYEPYKAHSYPLDSTLTLRGIPKLVDGKMCFDGDTYDADGTVTRKYGVVDLGSLNWNYYDESAFFWTNISSRANNTNVLCGLYTNIGAQGDSAMASAPNMSIAPMTSNGQIKVKNTAYTNTTTFKAAMSGIMLVYELATPTTEEADPYQHLQQCDPYGTEEYVSTGIVPIGHNSFYPENLRAKVEGLPWNFASLIAPTEAAFVATRNYTTGSLFIVSNVLYKATSNIANGGTITPNTNCTATTLAEIISALA